MNEKENFTLQSSSSSNKTGVGGTGGAGNARRMMGCIFQFHSPYHISAVVIAFFIITINIFVLILISLNKKLRKTPSNFLLLSFSLNDLFSGISIIVHVLPYYYNIFHGCMETGMVFKKDYLIGANLISYLMLLSAIGHLLLLSSERFISLYYALRYQSLVTTSRILLACAIVWILTTLTTMVQLSWIVPFVTNSISIASFQKHNYHYTLVSIIAFFFIPAAVLITQYTWLFLLIRRLVQTAPGTKKTDRTLKERKALIIYCAMFICFLVCCSPFMTIQLLLNINFSITNKLPSEFLEGVFLLRYIVSIVNPILYTLYKRDFRIAAKKTLLNPLCKKFFKSSDPTHRLTVTTLTVRDLNSSYADCSNQGSNNNICRNDEMTSMSLICPGSGSKSSGETDNLLY